MDKLFSDRTAESTMRATQLRGVPLIDPAVAHRVGAVVDVLIDPLTGRLAALDVQTGTGEGMVERVPAERVRRAGQHAVMLHPQEVRPALPPGEADRWIDLRALVGLEVLAESGDRVGELADALVNRDTLAIEAYELATPFWERWLGGGGLIRPEDVVSCSPELMIVSAAHRAPERVEEQRPLPEEPPAPAPAPPGPTPRTTIYEEETTRHPIVGSAPPMPPDDGGN